MQGYQTGFWHGDHIAAFTDTVVAPTCTEQGYTHHVCTVKGCTYAPVDDTYVAATDHTWVKTRRTRPPAPKRARSFISARPAARPAPRRSLRSAMT